MTKLSCGAGRCQYLDRDSYNSRGRLIGLPQPTISSTSQEAVATNTGREHRVLEKKRSKSNQLPQTKRHLGRRAWRERWRGAAPQGHLPSSAFQAPEPNLAQRVEIS